MKRVTRQSVTRFQMAGSERARKAFREAEQLAALLSQGTALAPAPGLAERIVRAARAEARPLGNRFWPFGNPLAPLASCAGALALGLWVGSGPLDEWAQEDADAAFELADETVPVDEWAELSDLSLAAEWALEEEP